LVVLKAHLGGTIFSAESQPTSGPGTVVALHGWGRDRSDFADLLQLDGVVVFDLPGFGTSPPPDQPWGGHDYARCVAAAVGELAADRGPLIVVGHSFGGRVALCLAAEFPHLVGNLVLIGVPLLRLDTVKTSRAIRIAKRANRIGLYSDRRLARRRDSKGSADYRQSSGVMRQILVRAVNEEYREELAAVSCPVELFWGRHDTAAPLAMVEAAADLLSVKHLSILDAGHDVHKSHADELRQLLLTLRAQP
jgi:pimeloyl-ACP methyl ester carboxylesterase